MMKRRQFSHYAIPRCVLLAFGLVLAPAVAPVAHAQPRLPGATGGTAQNNAPVTFTADQVEYDREHSLVIARGAVEAWQNDHVLRADEVTYNRDTGVAAASGHVVLLEPDGETLFASYAELTHNMQDGVLKNMGALLAENGRLAANGARRTDGQINELSLVVYS
jgi:LPS-assembly protein